jgi:2-keto-4-pentenoate hydratase/2-oxohepta-3-ene-1,7-dioic acid hydratase in catechol pathway
MRIMRIGPRGHERAAVVDGDGVVQYLPPSVGDVGEAFWMGRGVEQVAELLDAGRFAALAPPTERVGSPIARPSKVVCVGLNYRDHAEETGAAIPAEPILFMKAPTCVVGPYDEILIPRGSVKTDWEVELGVVIGARARYLESPADAAGVIGGYCLSHDVSEREFQLERGGQWDKGKSCETFNPLGPWLVTPGEVGDVQALAMRLAVNGVVRQNGTTADMIFPVDYLVWYISQFMVLEPGDLINTGTPAGVSLGHDDVPYLVAGDVVELSIDALGSQRSVMTPA